MKDIMLSTIVFVIVFLGRLLIYIFRKKKANNNSGLSIEMTYLINRFKLNKNKIDTIPFAALLSLIDALIIVISFLIAIICTDNIIIEILIGIIVVFILIMTINEILGRILKRKGYDK